MKKCQRCNSDDVSWTCDQVQLAGGVTAHLCAACLTDVDGVLRESVEWQELLEVDAIMKHHKLLALAGNTIQIEAVRCAVQRGHMAELAVREVVIELVKPNQVASA